MKKLTLYIVLLGVIAGIGVYSLIGYQVHKPLKLNASETIQINKGSSLYKLSLNLEESGTIDNSIWIRLYAKLNPGLSKISAGEYRVNEGDSVKDLLEKISKGDVITYKLTLVEGWNVKQAIEYLASIDGLVFDLPKNPVLIAKELGIEGHFEGRFYPATFDYVKGTKVSDILKQSRDKLDQVLNEEWKAYKNRVQNGQPKLPYKNQYEALIMASIIEKETGVAYEREQISGVFVRRLQKNMRLQTDPTVIYGMGDAYKGNIRKKDLQKKTPYNTYRVNGLPPTPIALAGRASIAAALNPDDSDKLYFVAKGDGSHYFSATNEEHVRAVRKYQIFKRKKDYRSSPEASD